ncbi:MAG TPA: LURP-one-related family protein, partial [Candidatus Limnocylindria bacterium]|nr:LURP-one-related family protein [Candidatus Limnocylindria bacterium]
MRYLMRQKFWAWADNYTIRNEANQDVFSVHGKAFSWGNKLSFRDVSGTEILFIRQKLLAWGPTYYLEREGQVYAEVRKQLFTLFRCRFTVDIPGPDDPEATGDFLDREYTFSRHGQTIATVSKRWFTWTDTYGVDIAPGEDEVLLLAATVVIDLVCHGDNE